jgi:adenosylcobinamide-GDP ribazoletransferase
MPAWPRSPRPAFTTARDVSPLSELAAAFTLLTRVRLPWVSAEAVPIAACVWAFPLVGGVAGAFGAAAYAACWLAGIPPAVSAVWSLAVIVLFTGAFHEDGLADTADGLGGGGTRERKLDIMRDSRIGSFGAIALVLSLAARGTAIAVLIQPLRVLITLVVAGALGRAAMIVLMLALAPSRADGLAAGLRELRAPRAIIGLAIAGLLTFLLLPFGVALRTIVAALIAALVLVWIAQRHISGYTGDVLGASSVVTECVVSGLLAGALLNS